MGHRQYHPQSLEAERDNTYRTNAKHNYLHGEGNFIKDDRWSAKHYANTGEARKYNYYWCGPDYYGYDADNDINTYNAKQASKDEENYKRALSAADKRPLHRKGSVNRELDESIRRAIRNVLR